MSNLHLDPGWRERSGYVGDRPLWSNASGNVRIDRLAWEPGKVSVEIGRDGGMNAWLTDDDACAMALAILAVGEPARVEWAMRIDFLASGRSRYTEAYWDRDRMASEVEQARRESTVDGDQLTYALVRREVYELPGGGSVTTGWTEVTE